MIELYQLRNIKRQTLQSDKVRRHEIIHIRHMLREINEVFHDSHKFLNVSRKISEVSCLRHDMQ